MGFWGVELKKKYENSFLVQTFYVFHILGLKIKYKKIKAPQVFGTGNQILLNGTEVSKIPSFEIYIEGNNNRVEIFLDEQSKVSSNKILIAGNNNQIHIDSPANITNVKLGMGKDNHKIFIQEKIKIYNGDIFIGRNSVRSSGENELRIGKNLSCGGNFHLNLYGYNQKILIGDDCMFSWNIYVWNSDGHPIFDKNTKQRLNEETDVVIGNHVWIGRHASIHKGAVIPDGCVVGANSFVSKCFTEKNAILAGAPAKVVRRNIQWEK